MILKNSFLKVVKIKPLIPSLRENNRYLLYEADDEINESQILGGIKEFIGCLGIAKANPVLLIKKKKKGILKVNNKYVNHVKTALMLIKENKVRTLKVSGMIKRLKNEI